jgi:hypothetical protein
MSRIPGLLIVIASALSVTPACFVRKRAVTTLAPQQSRPLLSATKDELLQRVHEVTDPIQSFVMKADLSPSVLDPSKGTATDYATVGAYILFRKPDEIRILGQDPVIGSTIFDMVSNGREFRVSIPHNKRFIIGNNDAPETSQNKLENLRPVALLTALMIYPPDPKTESAALENDAERAEYILLIIRRVQDQFVLARNIVFDRYTLQITRQKTFDVSGNITGDTKYSDWKSYGDASFPSEIEIQRPKENYEVQLSVVSMKFNTPEVTAAKFVLEQPPDTQLQEVK